MAKSADLRWHGWFRTRCGQITGYVKVRAPDAEGAVKASLRAAVRGWGDQQKLSGGRFTAADFVCIGVSLHPKDQDKMSP